MAKTIIEQQPVKKPRKFKLFYYKIIDLITFVPDGYKFVLGFLVASFLFFFVSTKLGLVSLVLAIFFARIFHFPTRVNKGLPNAVISPADGTIVFAGLAALPEWLQEKDDQEYLLISIAMGCFHSRVNVIPISGYIEKQVYQTNETSLFRSNGFDGLYESNVIFIKETRKHKRQIVVEQRAGFLKRSVVSFMYENDLVHSGEIFGILRFGKYVDIYLPADFISQVAEGQTMLAGETILGFLTQEQTKEKKKRIEK